MERCRADGSIKAVTATLWRMGLGTAAVNTLPRRPSSRPSRDPAVAAGIPRAVDGGHATAAKLVPDFVAAEALLHGRDSTRLE
jgi:hypothetical protein